MSIIVAVLIGATDVQQKTLSHISTIDGTISAVESPDSTARVGNEKELP